MCGRYYVDEALGSEIRELVYSLEKRPGEYRAEFGEELGISGDRMGCGGKDIHPSEWAELICMDQEQIGIRTMRWGFPGTTFIINARAETLLERSMFKESARYRRCLIPARKYYEWNKQKEKATFAHQEGSPLYMAGIYDLHKGEECFVIITTEANSSVSPVHHRMPLILEPYEAELWLKDFESAEKLLHKIPGTLQRIQRYEQISLWNMDVFLTNPM